jgi:hypothetical protein
MKYLIKAKDTYEYSYLQDPNRREHNLNIVVKENTENNTFCAKLNSTKGFIFDYELVPPNGGQAFSDKWCVKVTIYPDTDYTFQQKHSFGTVLTGYKLMLETNSFLKRGLSRQKVQDRDIQRKICHYIIPGIHPETKATKGITYIENPVIGQTYYLYICLPQRMYHFFEEYNKINSNLYAFNIRPVLCYDFNYAEQVKARQSCQKLPAKDYLTIDYTTMDSNLQPYCSVFYLDSRGYCDTTVTTTTTTTTTTSTTTFEPAITFDPITRTPKPTDKPPITLPPEPDIDTKYYINYTIYGGERCSYIGMSVLRQNGTQVAIPRLNDDFQGTFSLNEYPVGGRIAVSGSSTANMNNIDYYGEYLFGPAPMDHILDVFIHLSYGAEPSAASYDEDDNTNNLDGVLNDYENE